MKVLAYIEKGKQEGARVLVGGESLRSESRKGFFVAPTVFVDVKEDMTIWKEEIFGPVLSVLLHPPLYPFFSQGLNTTPPPALKRSCDSLMNRRRCA